MPNSYCLHGNSLLFCRGFTLENHSHHSPTITATGGNKLWYSSQLVRSTMSLPGFNTSTMHVFRKHTHPNVCHYDLILPQQNIKTKQMTHFCATAQLSHWSFKTNNDKQIQLHSDSKIWKNKAKHLVIFMLNAKSGGTLINVSLLS